MIAESVASVTPPTIAPALAMMISRFLYKGRARAMVAGPKRKLMNSAPASYCLYSTPGARTMTAMTRGQAITKGGIIFRLKRSMMISLIAYRITVRPMPRAVN